MLFTTVHHTQYMNPSFDGWVGAHRSVRPNGRPYTFADIILFVLCCVVTLLLMLEKLNLQLDLPRQNHASSLHGAAASPNRMRLRGT